MAEEKQNQDIAQLTQEKTQLQEQNTQLTQKLNTLNEEKTALRTQLDQQLQIVTTLNQEQTRLTEYLATVTQQKATLATHLNEEIQKLTQERTQLTNDLATMNQQNTDQTNQSAQEKQQLTDEKNQLQAQIETINNQKNELQNNLTQKQEENEQLTSNLASVNAEKQQLQNQIQILQENNTKLTNDLTELTNVKEQFQQQKLQVSDLKQKLSDLNQEKTILEQQQQLKLYYQNVSEFTQFNQTLNIGTLKQMFDDGFYLKLKEQLDQSFHYQTCVLIDGQKGSGKTFVLNGIANLKLEEDQKNDDSYQLQIVQNTEDSKLQDIGFLINRCRGNNYPIDKEFNELKENYQKAQDKKEKNKIELEYNQMVTEYHQKLKQNSLQIENEYEITQQLIKEFIYQQYDILIYCVEDFDREQQKDYQDIISNIKNNQKVFVVHVCKDATYNTQDLVEKKIQKNMSQNTFQIKGQQYTALDNACYKEFVNCESGYKTVIYHLMIGYQESEDVRTNINEKTFQFLRHQLINDQMELKQMDIGNEFLKFINEKLQKKDSGIKKLFQQYLTSEKETDVESQNDIDSIKFQFENIGKEEENCFKYALKKTNSNSQNCTEKTFQPQFSQNKQEDSQENLIQESSYQIDTEFEEA